MRTKLIAVLFLIIPFTLMAQIRDTSINMVNINVNYSAHFPGGDMKKRFGFSSMIGPSVQFKHKSKWSFGVQYSYIFGGVVKDSNIFDHLKDDNGAIINEYGEYGTILITERGFYLGGHVGRLIPLTETNPNSGLKLELGAGLLEHHIHIENKDNNVPGVLGDFKKGYDRRSNGFSLREFIGYQYHDPDGYINFYAGMEFYQSWTYNRRDINYDTGQNEFNQRNDYLFGFRVGWILSLYNEKPDNYYYY